MSDVVNTVPRPVPVPTVPEATIENEQTRCAVAAYFGYDAVDGAGDFVYLVLNRTAVRVQREDIR